MLFSIVNYVVVMAMSIVPHQSVNYDSGQIDSQNPTISVYIAANYYS